MPCNSSVFFAKALAPELFLSIFKTLETETLLAL
jgi:hypothetical protein